MDRYEKWKIKYTNMIKENDVTKPDFLSNNKIYEILYALKFKMILWSDLPTEFFQKFNIPHTRDYGIDLISLDHKICVQVKKPDKSRITWNKICNFRTYAKDILNMDYMILATIKNAKIDKMARELLLDTGKIKLIEYSYVDMMNEFLKGILSDNSIIEGYLTETFSKIEPEMEMKFQMEPELEMKFQMEPELEPELEPEMKFKMEPELETEMEMKPELESILDIEYNNTVKPAISLGEIMLGLLLNTLLPFVTFGMLVGLGVIINGVQLKNRKLAIFGFIMMFTNLIISAVSIILSPFTGFSIIGYLLSVPISYLIALTISIILLIRN